MTIQAGPPERGKDEPSLLEDASTLLMFSKGSGEDSKKSSTPSQSSQHQQQPLPFSALPLSRTSTHGNITPMNPQASPGPASVALMHNDSSSLREQGLSESVSHLTHEGADGSSGQERFDNQDDKGKGMVAAAALAAAATVPLPLKPHTRTSSNLKNDWPVPDSYIVDIDSGVITCICGYDDDDGFTIQCDHCNRWQHAICYNIKDIETAPDDYLCNVCQPRKLDIKRARKKQLERLQRHRPSVGARAAVDREVNVENGEIDGNVRAGPSDHEGRYCEDRKSSSAQNTSRERTDSSAGEEERKKKRKHEEVAGEIKKKKDAPIYLNAKDAYSEIYLPTESYEFRDKYVKMFIDRHNDDDWVIPYNGSRFDPVAMEVRSYADTNNSKVFAGFSKLGVHVGKRCGKGEFLCEYLGEVDFQKKYLMDPRNHYRIWGTTKVRVIFHPHWPLYIDARLTGNLARYVRRSCNPNVELATIRMNGSNEVKFVLRAARDLEEGEEIHLDWHWDLRHPVWQIIKGTATLDSLNDPDKYLLIHSIDAVLSTCDCACGTSNKDCVLLKVKKFAQALYRSVKSRMNNRYKLNEILNQYQGKKRRQPPILDRLSSETNRNEERAAHVLADFNAKRLHFAGSGKGQVYKSETVKPYKWRFLESHAVATNRPVGYAQITKPSEYDESKINDLRMLPIPIMLEVPLPNNNSKARIKIDAAVRSSEIPPNHEVRVQEIEQSSVSYEQTNTGVHLADFPDKKPIKKKLSFADYRKKQYK